MKPAKPIKLDKYEQSIEDNIQNFVPVSKNEREKIEAIIASARKTKNINIRISNYDIDRIRVLSASQGLPYQTFLGSIIHRYVSGSLIDEDAILKYIQMIRRNNIKDLPDAPTPKKTTKKTKTKKSA
jgi:predicted DNA binding CopG/RHH family protein